MGRRPKEKLYQDIDDKEPKFNNADIVFKFQRTIDQCKDNNKAKKLFKVALMLCE